MCAQLRWCSEIHGGVKEGMDTLGSDTWNSVTMGIIASSEHTMLKPALPGGNSRFCFIAKGVQFCQAKSSPGRGEGSYVWSGSQDAYDSTGATSWRHEGGPWKPRGRLEQKHLGISRVTVPSVFSVYLVSSAKLLCSNGLHGHAIIFFSRRITKLRL